MSFGFVFQNEHKLDKYPTMTGRERAKGIFLARRYERAASVMTAEFDRRCLEFGWSHLISKYALTIKVLMRVTQKN